jgi:predicted transcriptional regulator
MTTPTTIKLPDDLKERIAPLADAAGKTPHAWMIEALERQADLAEAREAFIHDAEASATEVDAGGALYAAEDVASYLYARAAGKRPAARPKALPRTSAKAPGKAPARTRPTRGRG